MYIDVYKSIWIITKRVCKKHETVYQRVSRGRHSPVCDRRHKGNNPPTDERERHDPLLWRTRIHYYSVLSTQSPVLNLQYSALSTQYSVLDVISR